MSNEEKKRLEEYKQKRMRLIIIQSCILIILTIASILLFLSYNNLNKMYYVTYTETSSIDYRVNLKKNNLFDDESLGEDYAYVSSLIDNIEAVYNYKIKIDADKIKYDLTYKADATVQIIDTTTNIAIYKPVYGIIDEVKKEYDSQHANISVPIEIDFNKYNDEVLNFINKLNLKATKATLKVIVTFNVESECEDYEKNDCVHQLSLEIPLNKEVFKISESQSIPTGTSKTIACEKGVQKTAVLIFGIVTLSLDIIGLIILIAFIYLTRNTHINYSIKVKKIVNSYKSFIQKINNVFDTTGYQMLFVSTFNEMLDIRDTLQSPILMSENEDKTMTQFIIPTTNNILYVFEVKIDNYDEIYGLNVETKEEYIENEIKTNEIESVNSLIGEDIVIDSEPIIIDEVDLVDDESELDDKNNFSNLRYSYSFEAKLVLSKEEVQNFYKQIINYIKSYGVKVSRSFKRERVHQGRKLFATFIYRGKTLCVLFPLDSKNEDFSKYRFIDMSEYKKYSDTPSLMKITSNRKVKYVIEVLEKIFSSNGVKHKNLTVKKENIKRKSKSVLIKEGLIKKINKE